MAEAKVEDPAKVLKKVIKEGGKRGVEIEGAADMGGLQFFCTSLDEPSGDVVLLKESMKAMNEKSDPTEEERKGGSGHIGKMIFSAGTEQLAVVAYVPEEKQGEINSKEWLEAVLATQGGSVTSASPGTSAGCVKADADKGIFPLKIRESMILEANNFLRARGLFPDNDDDDDDEMVFGDDDFPQADDYAAEPAQEEEVAEEAAECDIDDPFAMMGGMGEETIYKVTAFEEKAEAEESKEEEQPLTEAQKGKMKKVMKEGGKRGVEIEGAADMGGLQFFCTSVEEPQGDVKLIKESVLAMNEKSDPTEEERKGGSGHIGKMVFSAGVERLAIAAYCPEDKHDKIVCEEWLQKVVSMFPGGKIHEVAKDLCIGEIPTDSDKNIFPLKIREALILEANNYLRKLGLFPEDDGDDDDEMVFGDDDFPSM